MRKLLVVAALVAAGCQSGGGGGQTSPGDQNGTPEERIVNVSRLAPDPAGLKVGQWAIYTATIQGKPGIWRVKYAVVSQDPDGIWVENKIPAQPNPMVIKSKIGKDGKPLQIWIGEPGSPHPARYYSSEGKAADEPKRDAAPQANVKTTEAAETITAGGRSYACTKVTVTATYPDGRTTTETDWFSPEVPFAGRAGGKSYGGLVKRQYGDITVELSAAAQDRAQPELEIPK